MCGGQSQGNLVNCRRSYQENKKMRQQYMREWKRNNQDLIDRWYHSRPGYSYWTSTKQRCKNPNHPQYYNYGGKGIHLSFENFEEFQEFLFSTE